MSKQDAELFQILIGQIGKDAEINPVLIEDLGVLAKTEPGKPLGDLLHCSPLRRFVNASSLSKPRRDCIRGAYFWPTIVVAVLNSIEFSGQNGKKNNIANGDEPRVIPEIATCPWGMCLSDKLSSVPLQAFQAHLSGYMRGARA
jgi:hypothetical protein